MNINYSSYEKDKLLRILDSGKCFGDIDCFCDLARKIQSELERLDRRASWNLHQLGVEICSLERNIDEAQGRINDAQQDIQKDTITHYQKEIEACKSRIDLLREDERSLRDGVSKIPQYLSDVSNAINLLEDARKNAESNFKEVRQAIKNASVCMENYINVSGSYISFEAVRHIDPKEGW